MGSPLLAGKKGSSFTKGFCRNPPNLFVPLHFKNFESESAKKGLFIFHKVCASNVKIILLLYWLWKAQKNKTHPRVPMQENVKTNSSTPEKDKNSGICAAWHINVPHMYLNVHEFAKRSFACVFKPNTVWLNENVTFLIFLQVYFWWRITLCCWSSASQSASYNSNWAASCNGELSGCSHTSCQLLKVTALLVTSFCVFTFCNGFCKFLTWLASWKRFPFSEMLSRSSWNTQVRKCCNMRNQNSFRCFIFLNVSSKITQQSKFCIQFLQVQICHRKPCTQIQSIATFHTSFGESNKCWRLIHCCTESRHITRKQIAFRR